MARGVATAAASCPCPCGSGDTLDLCCGPLHRGKRKAETAEALMRSRYSAYARSELDYLIATHPMPSEAPVQRRCELKKSCRDSRWRGLKVLSTEAGMARPLHSLARLAAVYWASMKPEFVPVSSTRKLGSRPLKSPWVIRNVRRSARVAT